MSGIDLIIPVGADQHQILKVRPGRKILKQFERCGIEPLQVIEKEHQRMFGPGKHADKLLEYTMKTALRVLKWQRRNRRLFTDDDLEFWNQVHDELPVWG